MSGNSVVSRIIRNFFEVPGLLLAWVFVAPVAWLIPKRKDWIAVIGGHGRTFGNSKYFFLQATHELDGGARVVFVLDHANRHFAGAFNRQGFEVLSFPSVKSIWFLLRCGSAVTAASEWYKRCRPQLLIGAKLIQLWHGVGFKRLDHKKFRSDQSVNNYTGLSWFLREIRIYAGACKMTLLRGGAGYALFVSTSRFYEQEVFKPAFESKHFLVAGYPRNTFGRLPAPAGDLAWIGVDEDIRLQVDSWYQVGRKIILFAPTFRETRVTELQLMPTTLQLLDDFCEVECAELLFKFHPTDKSRLSVRGKHLHVVQADSDIYPIMPLTDALVTDYSSIYMDYLLLDKPVHFFVPDLEDYIHKDRELQFDYHEMTPGPKTRTWDGLLSGIREQWQDDRYGDERARLRKLAFDDLPQEKAVRDVLNFAAAMGWLKKSVTR